MKPIINLEDEPGKTVGRRQPPSDPLDVKTSSKVAMEEWNEALKTARIPRGVYRFHSHEEADEWLWNMITRKKD